eukprot:TRINITY_DN1074_c1_g1_i1.p1 TRINITY_DN1074_c1_g1~~TRINITY_DN1074_c1_g1_i1.p1  ORF type:complete len:565 (+),score=109.71 TRINITY_DN1074_c1_g1_i1:110-1804(+)
MEEVAGEDVVSRVLMHDRVQQRNKKQAPDADDDDNGHVDSGVASPLMTLDQKRHYNPLEETSSVPTKSPRGKFTQYDIEPVIEADPAEDGEDENFGDDDDDDDEEFPDVFGSDNEHNVSDDEDNCPSYANSSSYYLKSNLRVGLVRREPCKLTYELHGDGPDKILLIMGLCMSKEIWQHQVRYFCQNPRFQVCVLDNRGHAESHANNFYASTHTLALDCVELLRYLRWTNVHIIGLSMGGMIAQELSILLGESMEVEDPRIVSLTLACTHAGGRLAFMLPARCIPNIARWLLSLTPQQKTRSLMPMCYSSAYLKENFQATVDWHLSSYRHIYYRTLVSHLFAVLTHYVSYARLEKIKNFGFPTMVITGDQDTMVRPANSYALAEGLGARLHIVGGCGHMLNCERPDVFNALVGEHIDAALHYANHTSPQQQQHTTTTTRHSSGEYEASIRAKKAAAFASSNNNNNTTTATATATHTPRQQQHSHGVGRKRASVGERVRAGVGRLLSPFVVLFAILVSAFHFLVATFLTRPLTLTFRTFRTFPPFRILFPVTTTTKQQSQTGVHN